MLNGDGSSSFNVRFPCWHGLDSLTGADMAGGHTRLHWLFWHGFYGWMPFLMPTTLQSVLGACYVAPALVSILLWWTGLFVYNNVPNMCMYIMCVCVCVNSKMIHTARFVMMEVSFRGRCCLTKHKT
ncbi:Hypothetical predicted protein [Octopus vulgaris]|uniref:Uncharacterized protein n=1 Tax=Octopus vulgaris TaxID=6645 RepID=A0AA36FH47_OCTVU|nr:Hypothetical predicted protein [Octopus vulgaris]